MLRAPGTRKSDVSQGEALNYLLSNLEGASFVSRGFKNKVSGFTRITSIALEVLQGFLLGPGAFLELPGTF